MRELFFKIFGEKPENDFNKIEMFSWTHILYLVLILSVIFVLTILYYKKRLKNKKRILDIVTIIMTILYMGDFFMQPIYNGGTLETNGNLILDKFPFHICTVLCPLIVISRFSKVGNIIKTPFALLACTGPLMWLVYPGTALDTDQSAFSYVVFQLFAYHGCVFIYGCLYVLLEEEKLCIKKCYKEAIGTLSIALWATFGNVLYSTTNSDYNWFFLKDPVFGFIPKSINAFVVIVVIFLSTLLVYGLYYIVKMLYNKNKKINYEVE